MSLSIENLAISCLCETFSMNDWDRYVHRSDLRREYLCGSHNIRRWTLQRDLDRLGDHLEEVVEHLTKVTRVIRPDIRTDVYVDGTHIPRSGSKGNGVRYGEGGGAIQLQNQFMLASNIATGIPVAIEAYPGNLNDPLMFGDFVPQLLFLLKRGSLVVLDHGGSGSSVLSDIIQAGDHYITRKSLNNSDLETIATEKDRMVYIGMNVACIMDVFESSQRTKYLLFSADSYAAALATAERTVAAREILREKAKKALSEGNPMKGVKTEKNYFYEVVVDSARFVMTHDPWIQIDPEKQLKDAVPPRGGWFKLECSFPMDPRLALLIYRHRVDIEHLISALKSVVKLDPLRVWAEGTTRGRLVLALIVQFILSVLIDDIEPTEAEKMVDGKPTKAPVRPSARTVVTELERYLGVITRPEWGGFRTTEIRDPGVSDRIAEVLDRYDREGPVTIPAGLAWRTDPTAQWGDRAKNDGDLAMSIAQYYSEIIFPEYMAGRRHWRDIDPRALGRFEPSSDLDPGTIGARGLFGRTTYHPGTGHPSPGIRSTAQWTCLKASQNSAEGQRKKKR